jgi:ribonucleoside-diphosphate reductase alpha chain
LKKDDNVNVIESSEDLFYRVAENIAQVDKIYDKNTDVTIFTREFYLAMFSCNFFCLTRLL